MVSSLVGSSTRTGCSLRLQRRVSFDVLAIVVQGSGADALEFSSGQRWLEDVGSIDSAFCGARAYNSVHLIDEQHAVAGRLYLINDLLKAFLEFAAVLGARHEGAHVQRDKPACLGGSLRDFSTAYALGQGLHDGGLANARLTHQDRVVLGAPAEYLYYPLDFLFPPHNRVELVGPGGYRQVDAQLVKGGSLGGGARALRTGAGACGSKCGGVSARTLSRVTPKLSSTPAATPSPSRSKPSAGVRSRCRCGSSVELRRRANSTTFLARGVSPISPWAGFSPRR